MKRALFVLAGIACLASSPAFADESGKPPDAVKSAAAAEAAKTYTPRAGLWSLQLDGPAYPMWQAAPFGGYNTTRGIGVVVPTGGGNSVGSGGIGGSLGYTLSDLIEVGAALGFITTGNGGGGTSTGFNIEPFLKLNLGADMMASDSRLNPFVMAGLGFNVTSLSGQTTVTFITPELAGGIEFMLTHSFGISVYVPITLGFNTTNGGSAILGIGLGYGLVGYF